VYIFRKLLNFVIGEYFQTSWFEFIPSPEERLHIKRKINELIELVKSKLIEKGIPFEKIVAGGSTAKDTFLRGDHDIDIFVVTRFPERVLEEVFKEILPYGRRKEGELTIWHGVTPDGFEIDLVAVNPEYTKRWFTLDHTEIYSKLSESQKNAVRILKALFKTYTCYGAENGGITGVAVEELVRRFTNPNDSGINAVVKVCSEILKHPSPFWLQDPAGEKYGIARNLLASVYPEKWELIHLACRDFIRDRTFQYVKPSAERFAFIRESMGWSTFTLPTLGKGKDFDFQQARSLCVKYCNVIKQQERDVETCCCDAYSDGKYVAIAVKVPTELTPFKKHCIPPTAPEHAKEVFKKKYPRWYIDEDGSICTEIPRKITKPFEYIKEMITKEWKTIK